MLYGRSNGRPSSVDEWLSQKYLPRLGQDVVALDTIAQHQRDAKAANAYGAIQSETFKNWRQEICAQHVE